MRLGKEQAAGYVEDIEADAPGAEEVPAGQSERMPLAPVPRPATADPAVPVA
jgi:hypothetical protein